MQTSTSESGFFGKFMTLTLACLSVGTAGLSEAQATVVRVVDDQHHAVPYAVVQVSSNNPRVAD
jgi:hypothetical protein